MGRKVNNFDFTRGCFNHVGIAQHSFENFALAAQNVFVTRKDLVLTQNFQIAEFMIHRS
jgi:hypothetical protein